MVVLIYIILILMVIILSIYFSAIDKHLKEINEKTKHENEKAEIYPNLNGKTEDIYPEDHCNDNGMDDNGDVDPINDNPNLFNHNNKVDKL